MLLKMDRKVEAAGSYRDPSETLHTFSHRLRQQAPDDSLWMRISDWYREYALLRYGRTIKAAHVQQLQQRANDLTL
jgi:hypothetical protein